MDTMEQIKRDGEIMEAEDKLQAYEQLRDQVVDLMRLVYRMRNEALHHSYVVGLLAMIESVLLDYPASEGKFVPTNLVINSIKNVNIFAARQAIDDYFSAYLAEIRRGL